jgi:hypothetical protein
MPVLTITPASTNKDLATLLIAANAKARIHGTNITIAAEPGNTGDILLGSPTMTDSDFDVRLQKGESHSFVSGSGANDQNANSIQVRALTNNDKIVVQIAVS